MDVWGAILVLIRRFYLTAPIAAITLVAAWWFTHTIQPEYHATASVVLIGPTAQPPAKDAAPWPVNPYAQMGTSTIATTLQIDIHSQKSSDAILASGNTTDFTINGVNKTPILSVTSTSMSPQQAMSTAGQVLGMLQRDLADRQNPYDSNKSRQVTAQVISPPELQGADTSARVRAEAIAYGLAVVLTIILVLVIDNVLVNRDRRRRREAGEHEVSLDRADSEHRTSSVRS